VALKFGTKISKKCLISTINYAKNYKILSFSLIYDKKPSNSHISGKGWQRNSVDYFLFLRVGRSEGIREIRKNLIHDCGSCGCRHTSPLGDGYSDLTIGIAVCSTNDICPVIDIGGCRDWVPVTILLNIVTDGETLNG
jgi:hypothetical protein